MIGVFDSGFGGLTILRALVDKLPQYSYCYLGDNARAPYGNRTSEEIYEFTREGVTYLFERGCPLVILACNTASAVALRRLQQEWLPRTYPDRRILGILVPTIEQITSVPWKHEKPSGGEQARPTTIGVLATEQTVRSGAYEHEIKKRNQAIQVVQQACPGLVEAIEADMPHVELGPLVEGYVTHLQERIPADAPPLEAVLLGCTHYELIAELIARHLPPEVRLYEQPTIVAKSLEEYLKHHPEVVEKIEQQGTQTLLTTGGATRTARLGERYFGEVTHFQHIDIA